MEKRPVIGVMGGGAATPAQIETAYRLGAMIATEGWVLLNGGRNAGIMEASAKGAWDHGGITVGVLPGATLENASQYITIPILTGMGNARNCINVLSSDVVVACPGGAGTFSEIALALKTQKPVILLDFEIGAIFENYTRRGLLRHAKKPEAAIHLIKTMILLK